MKIKLHSITSLITNSSTTIYTKSEGSIKPFKALINEMLTLMGTGNTCDEIFNVKIVSNTDLVWDMAVDAIYNGMDDTYLSPNGDPDEDKISKLLEDVESGKIEAPGWLEEIKEYYEGDTELEITVKDPKYKKLAKLAIKFLYSTEAVEHRC